MSSSKNDLEKLLLDITKFLQDMRDDMYLIRTEEIRQLRHTLTGYFVMVLTVVFLWLFWFQK